MLTKERLEQEITACKETKNKLEQIRLDSIAGIEINEIVQKGFEEAFSKL